MAFRPEKIRETKFKEYHYERFTDTLRKYSDCENSLSIWKQGIEEKIFYPQFHGREHLNVNFWLNLLQQGHRFMRVAFDQKCWGLSNGIIPGLQQSIQAAYECTSEKALKFHKESIVEGLRLFEETFGFRPQSFIATNYIWYPELEDILYGNGVNIIQGMKYQLIPYKSKNGDKEKLRHTLGETNKLGQIYLIRNCTFEPSLRKQNQDCVESCMKDISNAFLWNKPAIISTHRLNFIGSLCPQNRKKNLEAFSFLLEQILKYWPEVEFMTSVELGNLIKHSK